MPDLPPLGQGTWHMGERGADWAAEADALRLGIDLGMTLIDTAEMYADGGSEEVVAAAIAGRRDRVHLVSKAYPQNAGSTRLPQACERSLKRLGVERIDLYLLHWRGAVPLAETVEAMTRLVAQGKIGAWGVSNFDVDDMEELFAAGGTGCAANQVLYNLGSRGIAFDLLPWCRQRSVPVMAYSPIGQAGRLLRSQALVAVAARHGVMPAQAAIAWTLQPGVVSIPKAADPIHVRQNAAAATVHLTEADHATLDAAHKPPSRKQPLDML
jgi:diketogulonate reductase-like aldo/keto reductase